MTDPKGWRHRLALIEAADLSWFVGDRIGPDQLALWISLRLSGGPGPEVDLSAFLDRRDSENMTDEGEPFADRASSWLEHTAQAADLHPIIRACMGFHLWSLASPGHQGPRGLIREVTGQGRYRMWRATN